MCRHEAIREPTNLLISMVIMKNEVIEPSRSIPVIDHFDVVVVGGGVAGVAAAIAAGRNGARVALIEKENVLGGLATLGLVLIYLPLCDGKGRQMIGGLGEELLKASVRYGGGEIPDCWTKSASVRERSEHRYRVQFNAAVFAIALEELILELPVTLMYDTRFCDVIVEEGRVNSVVVENKSGRLAVGCSAVVDASGDADVCHRAGENTVSLNTNRKSGWFLSHDEQRVELRTPGEPYWLDVPEGSRTYAGDDWRDVTEMSIESRRLALADVKRIREKRKDDKLVPLVLPAIPQFRTTRRLVSSFELDETDEGKQFEDTIGMTGDWRKAGPRFCIPYRCLVGQEVDNLIAAGRIISATTSAWEITRVIPPCVVTGEAAGTAAAMAVRNENRLRGVRVEELQSRLKAQGVVLPG